MNYKVIIANNSFKNHIFIINDVLFGLENTIIQVNTVKCKWTLEYVICMVFVLKREVTKPHISKVNTVIVTKPLKSKHHIEHFIRIFNFYRYL